MTTPVLLIVGLGNPGAQYTQTRHNAGFWFVDALTRTARIECRYDSKFHGEVAKCDGTSAYWLLKPTTFMNHSGRAVQALQQFYKIPATQMLVVHDDLDLPVGTARLKRGGGHGGHNGLRDIIAQLGTPDFLRLRLGIGHPGQREQVVDYVLKKASVADKQAINDAIERSLTVLPELLSGAIEKAMQRLHS